MIRKMTSADIPAGMQLKQAAGWNQTEQDWANVLTIEPEGCWVFEAENAGSGKERSAETVAGSATAVCFGRSLAWIGMVLVLPEFRRRGIAGALMEHALEFVERRQVECVKLDATDMGRPLYARLGFGDESLIERWGAAIPDSMANSANNEAELLKDIEQIAHLDHKAFGADRMSLLRLLAKCQPDNCLVSRQGYVMARPGSNAHFLGPCVAESPAGARPLIQAMASKLAGRQVFWDLLPENHAARELAEELGFEKKRSLVRMSRPGCSGFNRKSSLEMQFATAGFEYG